MRGVALRVAVVAALIVTTRLVFQAIGAYAERHAWDIAVLFVGAVM